MPLPLATADKFAARIRAEMEPFCERIEIAGSIRRRRPFVNDVDVVVLPKPHLEAGLRERVKLKAERIITDGLQTLVVILTNDLQVDVWIAQPESRDLLEVKPSNFGSLLLCRTGSTEHNIYLIDHAKRRGLIWNPYHGVFSPIGGKSVCIASATEEEIFAALQLEFIPPEKRER
jgi:DNA polymerase (family 10)